MRLFEDICEASIEIYRAKAHYMNDASKRSVYVKIETRVKDHRGLPIVVYLAPQPDGLYINDHRDIIGEIPMVWQTDSVDAERIAYLAMGYARMRRTLCPPFKGMRDVEIPEGHGLKD